jgi:ABC-2 type transport system ATP-binding protein
MTRRYLDHPDTAEATTRSSYRADACEGGPVTDSLDVVGVVQAFEGRRVLDGVDLEVPPGTVVGLLGPNGAGKTTLMRIVFGVLEPETGEVRWRGRPATAADRRRWGYMPQERGLYREMRCLDHLVWLARLYGVDRRAAERRASELLERLGLADRARDPIRDLSGGMAQRVQLAAAMVHQPELLVLDEPFSGLDPTAVAFLTEVIRDHVTEGGHLVFSSHQLDLVEDLCESIVMIHRGRVVLHGEVRSLRRSSPDRFLRVDAPVGPEVLDAIGDAADAVIASAAGSRIRLAPGADPGAVLDAVRARADVQDFAVEAPRLSELFLAAVGDGDDADDPAAAPAEQPRHGEPPGDGS